LFNTTYKKLNQFVKAVLKQLKKLIINKIKLLNLYEKEKVCKQSFKICKNLKYMHNLLKRNKYQFQQMDLDKNSPHHKYMNPFNKLKNKLLS